MQNPDDQKQFDVKLQISFPKSDQDHRLQLVKINDSIFAIVHSPLESNGPVRLYCEDWSLILLSPIKSKTNIVISAINLICLNEIRSEEGLINLHATKRLMRFGSLITPPEKTTTIVEGSETELESDAGAVLQYYRLFQDIVNEIHTIGDAPIELLQKKFISTLCLLAEKIEGKSENLDLRRVLDIWGISDESEK